MHICFRGLKLRLVKQCVCRHRITGTLKLESGSGPYGDDLAVLSLSIEYQRENRVRIRIYDPFSRRWEGSTFTRFLFRFR